MTRTDFWDRVMKGDGCWLWAGKKDSPSHGLRYGTVTMAGGVRVLAHRYAWIDSRGAIPPEMCVLHRCDVPLCVRPDHLFLGTRGDNNRDRTQKGRGRPGSRTGCKQRRGHNHPRAKLTLAVAEEMRRLHAAGCNRTDLAKRFGVGWTLVDNVVKGRKWTAEYVASGLPFSLRGGR